MKTILASALVLSTLATASLPALAQDGGYWARRATVQRSVRAPREVRTVRPQGEVRQAESPAAAEGARMFPHRGYGTQSSMDMLRDVQAASRSGLYTAPSR